jgi:hypothetical protein
VGIVSASVDPAPVNTPQDGRLWHHVARALALLGGVGPEHRSTGLEHRSGAPAAEVLGGGGSGSWILLLSALRVPVFAVELGYFATNQSCCAHDVGVELQILGAVPKARA